MRYDDRLATVLRIRPASPAVARIQFQQLVDLLGTSPADARSELLDEAYVRITELSARIPAAERAAALGLAGLRLRSPRLVAGLCAAEPIVAQAAIRAADLTETQWLDLIPALPAASRSLLRARRDFTPPVRTLLARLGIGDAALPATSAIGDAALPAADTIADVAIPATGANDDEAPPTTSSATLETVAQTVTGDAEPIAPAQTVIPLPLPAAAPTPPPPSGIGAIVERIEAFRRARNANAPANDALASDLPQLPLGDTRAAPTTALATIDFTTDAAGRIAWCQHPAAPLLVGTGLAGFTALRTAIRQRQPIRRAMLTLAGGPAIAGDWQVDAVPRFDSGRFTGYIGRLRRPAASVAPSEPVPTREADSLRQVLHELRTPVNAIQGFAEVIQHQLYGPTPHEYRALAANIVADAARMLAGFEELERLARLQTGAIRPEPGECDLAAVLAAAIAQLQPQAEARGFALALAPCPALPVALAPAEAERLCWRLLTTVSAAAIRGEALTCTATVAAGEVRIVVPLPAALADLEPQALFSATPPVPAAEATPQPGGMFGTGFALRLARAEARASGGSLVSTNQNLNLSLPVLTLLAHRGDNDLLGRTHEGAPAA